MENQTGSLIRINNQKLKMNDLKTVSLFSGCGGMDIGFGGGFSVFPNRGKKNFSKNPFDIIWANDVDKGAIETYKKNIGKHIDGRSICDIPSKEIPSCDIIIGGFPCQDFSIAGKMRGFNAPRGNLYKEMVRIIKAKKPKAFVAENVKNIISNKMWDSEKDQPVITSICEEFEAIGYTVQYKCLSAPDYGIPQRRERVFIIGIRNDIDACFSFPESFHPPMTSKEAIDDLWGKESDARVYNHDQVSFAKFRPHSNKGSQGNQMIPEDGPSHVMRAEHHMNIQAHYRTTHPKNDLNDRSKWRRLTVREAARLQTFPDKFHFTGSKSSCYKQVGNAVPPILGWYVARSLCACLDGKV